jgi:hypothetical protein
LLEEGVKFKSYTVSTVVTGHIETHQMRQHCIANSPLKIKRVLSARKVHMASVIWPYEEPVCILKAAFISKCIFGCSRLCTVNKLNNFDKTGKPYEKQNAINLDFQFRNQRGESSH